MPGRWAPLSSLLRRGTLHLEIACSLKPRFPTASVSQASSLRQRHRLCARRARLERLELLGGVPAVSVRLELSLLRAKMPVCPAHQDPSTSSAGVAHAATVRVTCSQRRALSSVFCVPARFTSRLRGSVYRALTASFATPMALRRKC